MAFKRDGDVIGNVRLRSLNSTCRSGIVFDVSVKPAWPRRMHKKQKGVLILTTASLEDNGSGFPET
jgi:hypothetical protein